VPNDELLESGIVLDTPHPRTPFMLREQRQLYLTLIKVPVEATRVFDAIADVLETGYSFHAHSLADSQRKSTK
jgi:hypothetical protein